jgi:hypothetical protein
MSMVPRRASRRIVAVVSSVLGLTTVACLSDVTGVRELSMSMMVAPTTLAVGDTLDVTYTAQGTGLALVVVDFGDGTVDSATFSGPIQVEADLTHVYAVPGSYIVMGAATGIDGTATDTAAVTVN